MSSNRPVGAPVGALVVGALVVGVAVVGVAVVGDTVVGLFVTGESVGGDVGGFFQLPSNSCSPLPMSQRNSKLLDTTFDDLNYVSEISLNSTINSTEVTSTMLNLESTSQEKLRISATAILAKINK